MSIFTGEYPRSIDSKNRIQVPNSFRSAIDPELDGRGLYVTLGEYPRTLAMFTEREFEALTDRMETEFMAGDESRKFELQFYSLARRVEMDKQGRIVLPEHLTRKARLSGDVCLVGQRRRIEVWDPEVLSRVRGIDMDGDDWPNWPVFTRARPAKGSTDAPGPSGRPAG
ncbi:MAG: hypothetical protein IIB61_06080 [Planctomycetes bacterium]|nr:hypothetical protein [Planctomycetota bacterium]